MLDELLALIRNRVLQEADLTKELSDEDVRILINQVTRDVIRGKSIGIEARERLENTVFHSLRGLDAIQELVDDPTVTEIMVNGPFEIFYERAGHIYSWEKKFASEELLGDTIQRIVGAHNRVVNMSSPIVDSRLKDGSRVNVVLSPISLGGSALTIRKFPEKVMTMENLIQIDSLTEEAATFLQEAVSHGYSILVSGGTGSGKTTFLNALSAFIPTDERIITIEDSAELQLNGIKNLVRLETRGSNQNQVEEITIRQLIRTALRMRPDRIIVGEVRGQEAFDMLQAMNTGHDGSMSTAHANSCKDALSRLEMMVRMGMDLPLDAIRAQIASGIDLIIQLNRMSDKSRKVMEIVEVEGFSNDKIKLNIVFGREEGALVRKGQLKNCGKMDL